MTRGWPHDRRRHRPTQPPRSTRRARGTGAPSAPPSSGWLVVAAKEFADQLLSVRFIILFAILGLAAAFPLFIAAERIRDLAQDASGAQAVFIAMFIIGPPDFAIFGLDFTVAAFIGLTAPLLGIAFAFDAVNGERAQGTLPGWWRSPSTATRSSTASSAPRW